MPRPSMRSAIPASRSAPSWPGMLRAIGGSPPPIEHERNDRTIVAGDGEVVSVFETRCGGHVRLVTRHGLGEPTVLSAVD